MWFDAGLRWFAPQSKRLRKGQRPQTRTAVSGGHVFYMNIDFSIDIGIDARKGFEMTANKFQEREKAKRVADELQLMREQAANELFSRLYPQIERLVRNCVDVYAHDARVGNILSVTTPALT